MVVRVRALGGAQPLGRVVDERLPLGLEAAPVGVELGEPLHLLGGDRLARAHLVGGRG